MAKSIVVLGARNLGGAVIDHFRERGWSAAGVARSEETLAGVRNRGAIALSADAADADSLRNALAQARQELGSLDAIVNTVSAARPPGQGPFAAAQELRRQGIHAALLAVDATIESPKTAAFTSGQPPEALADMADVAQAVEFLVEQGPRGLTHELVLTPAGERWVP